MKIKVTSRTIEIEPTTGPKGCEWHIMVVELNGVPFKTVEGYDLDSGTHYPWSWPITHIKPPSIEERNALWNGREP